MFLLSGLTLLLTIATLGDLLLSIQTPTVVPTLDYVLNFVLLGNIAVIGGVTYRLASEPPDRSQNRSIVLWTISIMVFGGLMGGLYAVHLVLQGFGLPLDEVVEGVLLGLTVGGAVGAVTGFYKGRSERNLSEVEAQRNGFQFLNSALRHNILNSINVVEGYAAKLEDSVAPDHQPHMRIIRDHSRAVGELIENAGTIARFYGEDLELVPVNLSRMVEREMTLIEDTYDRAEIRADIPPDVHIQGTPLLSAVFENLLSNAIEHNDTDTPRIEISVSVDGQAVVVAIADNGPGIPAAHREAVFEPGDHSEQLGLYIAKTLVTDIGGTIDIEENEPRGTVIQLEFARHE